MIQILYAISIVHITVDRLRPFSAYIYWPPMSWNYILYNISHRKYFKTLAALLKAKFLNVENFFLKKSLLELRPNIHHLIIS